MKKLVYFWGLLSAMLLAGCEKVVVEDETPAEKAKGNVILSVGGFEQMDAKGRSEVSISEVCSRLHFVIYKDGEKVKSVNQNVNDSGFGSVELSLAEGDYQVLILGHSCPGKDNPSISNINKIQFTNITESGGGTGYSDTFWYYGDLTVGSQTVNQSFVLKRAVASFRFVTTDVKPEAVKRVRFYYTGGSGAFDATTGLGNVKSTQVVFFDTSGFDGQTLQFDLFTFLHGETGELKFQVKAFNANNDILFEREFENVPMKRNSITQYAGVFFEADAPDTPVTPDNPDTPSEAAACSILVDTDWASTEYYTF